MMRLQFTLLHIVLCQCIQSGVHDTVLLQCRSYALQYSLVNIVLSKHIHCIVQPLVCTYHEKNVYSHVYLQYGTITCLAGDTVPHMFIQTSAVASLQVCFHLGQLYSFISRMSTVQELGTVSYTQSVQSLLISHSVLD